MMREYGKKENSECGQFSLKISYLCCWLGVSKMLTQAAARGSQAQCGSRARTQSTQERYLLQKAVGDWTTPESEPAYKDRVCGGTRLITYVFYRKEVRKHMITWGFSMVQKDKP